MNKPKRILVVNVNWLGDAIMTTPVFKGLKESFIQSFVAVMVTERVKDVFIGNPYIDEVIIFDEKDKKVDIFQKIKIVKLLRDKKFDTAYFIQKSFTRLFICFLAGIKNRIGFDRPKNNLLLTKRIKALSKDNHRQKQYCHLFEQTGIVISDYQPRIFISQDERVNAEIFLKNIDLKYSKLVAINPSANWAMKRWPIEYFAKLADRIITELNCEVVFIGADKEKELIESLINKMKNKAYNFCGKTTIRQLAAIIERINLFISNDSGPAHLAAAQGIATIAIFGPTAVDITGPIGKYVHIVKSKTNCAIPCYNLKCSDNICMRQVAIDDVFDIAKKIINA